MEYRCYHFGNMYLSSIQHGIQAAHAQMELFVAYDKHVAKTIDCESANVDEVDYAAKTTMLYDWATNHKTTICLNGGYLSNMKSILLHLTHDDNPFPFASFRESDEAMGGMLTNIAIVLPQYIYETASWLRGRGNQLVTYDGDPNFYYPESARSDYANQPFSWWEGEFMNMLNKCGLAA